jgi:hypothetical protein
MFFVQQTIKLLNLDFLEHFLDIWYNSANKICIVKLSSKLNSVAIKKIHTVKIESQIKVEPKLPEA